MSIRLVILSACILGSIHLSACSKTANAPRTSATPNQTNTTDQSRKLEIEKADLKPINETILSADELIKAYNTRNLGSPGWRRVLMELITDNRVTSTFTVVNIWDHFENEERTLFLLEEPGGLKGTSYLLRENRQSSPDMQVHIFLPAGERKVLEVTHADFDEGLLGSDFTYNDMRMLLPVKGWRYRVTGTTRLVNEPAWVIEAQPLNNSNERISSWSRIQIYLARNFQLLLGADFFVNDEDKKQMRVQSFARENDVWTPTRMVMAASQQRFTLLTLKTAHFSTATIAPEFFSPDHLPLLGDKIRTGWTPET